MTPCRDCREPINESDWHYETENGAEVLCADCYARWRRGSRVIGYTALGLAGVVALMFAVYKLGWCF